MIASQGWLPPRLSRLKHLACAIGLAAAGLAMLLVFAGQGAPLLSASGGPGAAAARGAAWAETGDITATWTSTQPIATLVDKNYFPWWIPQHGVTVTFYPNSVVSSAWFTFTPKSPSALPGSYLPTPYFFDLESEYIKSGNEVSLGGNGIKIEVIYDESRLTGIDPRTLQFFHFGSIDWNLQGGDVDLIHRTVTLQTNRTRSFAVGGQPFKKYLYLPFVILD